MGLAPEMDETQRRETEMRDERRETLEFSTKTYSTCLSITHSG